MRAWHVEAPGPVTGHPLRLHTEDDIPWPGPGELLLRVLACGVCRTDLHVTEGDLPPHRPGVTPGHEVVGEVADLGEGAAAVGFAAGDRAGAAWLRWTDGTCAYCRRNARTGARNRCTTAGTLMVGTPSTVRAEQALPIDPLAGGSGGSSPRANRVRGYHGCITSPVWHCRDGFDAVQWTFDHVPLQPCPVNVSGPANLPRTAEPGRNPRAPYTGVMVPIVAAGSLPAQIIRTPNTGPIPGFC